MNRIVLAALAAIAIAGAQTPASSNVPGAEYPAVHPDRRVTFRIAAPSAQKVQLMPGGDDNGLGKGPFEMARDDKGVWTVTIPPAVPGFHYYWFLVDGVPSNDPGSRAFFGWSKDSSGVDVPDSAASFYEVKDTPHGEIRIHWYYSKVTAMWRRIHVYTPPGYDSGKSRYPVLYLQHGAGENDSSWPNQGRAGFILDNLIAERKAVPMIVVMENGMVAPRAGFVPPADGARGPNRRNEAFGDLVTTELIPMVDATYRTQADRAHRAIAGLSMGAGQAMQIGLANLDLFCAIGSFSGGAARNFDAKTSNGGVFADADAFNKKVRVFWIGAGSAEPPRSTAAKAMVEGLNQAGIHAVWFESPGTSHEWQTWRKSLYDFAPRLFR